MTVATLPSTTAGPGFQTICEDLFVRRMGRTVVMENALAISEHYDGRVVVPMPEMDADERPAIANLIAQNIDQHAMRVASVRPSITVYATDPSKAAAQKLARTQKRVLYSWDDDGQREIFDRRRARWLTAWAEAPVVVRPDPVRRCPVWELRSPLGCYPSPIRQYDDMRPIDVINVFERTYQWLKTAYPQLDTLINVGRRIPYQNDARFEVIEYDGPEALVTGVLGVGTVPPLGMLGDLGFVAFPIKQTAKGQTYAIELERVPNLIEKCTAVVPGRITLDMPKGLADDMVGIFQMEAKMLALHVNAVARAIYPNDWFVETAQGGEIITQADGLKGITGHVRGGTMQTLGSQPGAQTMGVINALERNGRISGAAPAEYGGECVDELTEILTSDGWKRYDQIGVGTEVLTLNHDSGMSQWQQVEQMNVYPAVPHEMIEMHGPRFSALTTPNHRWPVVRPDGSRKWRTTTQLASNDRIPMAAMCADVPSEQKWTDALVEVVAWYYTEGSFTPSKGQISQSVKNGPKVDRIRAALTNLWGAPTPNMRSVSGCGQGGVGHDGVPRWNESPPSKQNGVIKFNLSAHATRHLAEFAPGKEKVPTFEFLRSLTQSQLELFLHVSMLADNCGEVRFGQKNKAVAEAFAFAQVLSGGGVSFQTKTKVEAREGWRAGPYTAHIVRMCKRIFTKPIEAHLRGITTNRVVTDTGITWCPTVGNQSWFARRNGTAYFTGNSPSNVRTAQRGLNVASNAIDFYIQEHQQILARSEQYEKDIAIRIDKEYFAKDSKSFFVNSGPNQGKQSYVPEQLWATVPKLKVKFNNAGMDANAIVTSNGQKLGEGTISRRTVMEQDPAIEDVEAEEGLVTISHLQDALIAGTSQQVQSGQIALTDLAQISLYVESGDYTLAEALLQVQKEAQVRQASAGPPGSPAGPVAPGSPAAQVGLQAGAAGAAQPTVGGPSPSQVDLKKLISTLAAGGNIAPQGGQQS